MSRSAVFACLGLLVLVVSACGGGGGDGPARPPRKDVQDAIEDVAEPPEDAPAPKDVPPKKDVPKDVPQKPDTPAPADLLGDVPEDVPEDVADDVPGDIVGEDVPVLVRDVVTVDVPVQPPEDVVVGETCFSSGECQDWDVDVTPCERKVCRNYRCTIEALADGDTCDDGLFCTEADNCFLGECGGRPKECGDADVCNGDETCDEETDACLAGAPLDCVNSVDACLSSTCITGIGCVDDVDPRDCDDGDPCNGDEICVSDEGGCVDGEPPCPADEDGNLCNGGAACRVAAGRAECIVAPPVVCDDDGNKCNGDETCEPTTGACVLGPPPPCPTNPLDDTNWCDGVQKCVPATGCVEHLAPRDYDDGDPCNGVETCDPTDGSRIPGENPCPPSETLCGRQLECVLLPGANPPFSCQLGDPVDCDNDNPCDGRERCQEGIGCIPDPAGPIDCDDGDPCTGVEQCDEATGGCIPGTPVVCGDGNKCNGDEVCDSTTGACTNPPDVDCDPDDDPCNGSGECIPETGLCRTIGPLECDDGDPCNGLETCAEGDGCIDGVPPCADDGDACNGEERCDPDTGACLPNVPLECDDDNSCTEDSCSRATGCVHVARTIGPCDDDDACTIDEHCGPEGTCIDAHAICLCPDDDQYEANDDLDTAKSVTLERDRATTSTIDGVLCGADEDWFRLPVQARDRIEVTLTHDAAYGDTNLRLVDATGALLADSTTDQDVEELLYRVVADGNLFLVVSGTGIADFENYYALEILHVPVGVCVEDTHEQNDTLATATPITVGSTLSGNACPEDADWFRTDVAAGRTLVVDLAYVPEDEAVSFALLGADESLVDVGAGVPGHLRAQVVTTDAATYYPRINIGAGGDAGYALTVQSYAPTACIDDYYEPNDDQVSAYVANWGVELRGTSCGDDVDWYAMDLEMGDTIVLDLRFDTSRANLNLYLHGPVAGGSPTLRAGTSINANEHVEYYVDTPGRYGIRVFRIAGVDPNIAYTLAISGSGGEVTCQEDGNEENDTAATATPLVSQRSVSGTVCPRDEDWYAIDLSYGDTLDAVLAFAHSYGDLSLTLFDPTGRSVLSSTSTDDDESVHYEAVATGRFTLLVAGVSGATNAYTILADASRPTSCTDDAQEDDDTAESATPLTVGVTLTAASCPGDDDWFRFPTTQENVSELALTYAAPAGSLDCGVYDEEARLLAECEDVPGGGSSRVQVRYHTGPVFVHVYGTSDASLFYEVDLAATPVEAPCDDDDAEENDTLAGAAPYPATPPVEGVICPGDPDFFTVTVAEGESLTADLTFDEGIDLDLALFDPSGGRWQLSTNGTTHEQVGGVATVAGTYTVQVVGETTAAADYNLLVSAGGFTCGPDVYEPNDTFATATPMSDGDTRYARRCAGNDDWFGLMLEAGEKLDVRLEFASAQGDLTMDLHVQNGATVAMATGTADGLGLSFEAPSAGPYALRVSGDADAENLYTVSVAMAPPPPPCTNDGAEPNDDRGHATPLTKNQAPTSATLCAGESDWFVFTPAANERSTVTLTFQDGAALACALLGTSETPLATCAPVAGGLRVELGQRTDPTYLRILGGGEVHAPYQVALTTTEVLVCVEDEFEQNDDIPHAHAVTFTDRLATVRAMACIPDADVFAFDVAAQERITLDLAYAGDVVLTLDFYDPDGVPIDSVQGTAGAARVVHTTTWSGRYYARVRSVTSTPASVGYTLTARTEVVHVCPEDTYEQNDDPTTATSLTATIQANGSLHGQICAGDEDWFQLALTKRSQLTLELAMNRGNGDIALELRNAAGTPVGTTERLADRERVTFSAPASPTTANYTVRVSAGSGIENSYTLTPTVTAYVCQEEATENNDTAIQARALTSETPVSGAVCGSDEDWYYATLQAGDLLQAELTFLNANGNLQLALIGPDRTTVLATSTSTADAETVSARAATAGPHYVRIYGATGGVDSEYVLLARASAYACTNDAFEPTTTDSPATLAGAGVRDARICLGDEDYYAITVRPGETLVTTVSFQSANGDLDLELQASDGTMIARSATTNDMEQLSYQSVTGGTYRIRVYPATAAAENSYTLAVSIMAYECTDDGLEENDSLAAARALTRGTPTNGKMCYGDEDWFSLTATAGETIVLRLDYTASAGDLQLELRDATNTVIGSSRSPTDLERVSQRAPSTGTYYVRVYAEPGAENTYTLTGTVEAYLCSDDIYEDNDTRTSAWQLPSARTVGGQHCVNDDDWFAITLRANDVLTAHLTYAYAAGDLTLTLYGPDGTQLVRSATNANEHAVWVALQAGTYTVAVTAGAGVDNAYSLQLTAGVYECIDDASEQNDTRATATTLTGGAPLTAKMCSADDDWYSIALEAGQTLTLDLTFLHDSGDLDMALVSPSGSPVAVAQGTVDNERITLLAAASGVFAVRVYSPVNAVTTYTIGATIAAFVCTEDVYEDNDTFGAARPITRDTDVAGSLCVDEDWFSFDVEVSDAIQLDLSAPVSLGNLDMQLFQPSGGLAKTAATSGDSERITHVATERGTHRVRLYGRTASTEGIYSLRLGVAPYVCEEDAYEQNDTQAAAAALVDGASVEGEICPADPDWFSIALVKDDTLTLDLTFENARGNLDLYLHRPDGQVARSSLETTADIEHIVYTAPADGVYGIRVVGVSGARNGYVLDLDVRGANECVDDSQEPNDAPGSATAVTPGTPYPLQSCPANDDWFVVNLGVRDKLTVTATFTHDSGNLDMILRSATQVVATSATSSATSNLERIQYTALVAGPYYVWIYGDGPIVQNAYTLSTAIESPPPGCTDDGFEENDTQAQAAARPELELVSGAPINAQLCAGNEDWFPITLASIRDVELSLTYTLCADPPAEGCAGGGDLSLTLFDANGNELRSSSTVGISETISMQGLPSGSYAVRVNSGAGVANAYTLAFTSTAWVCQADVFEANDIVQQARPIDPGTTIQGTVCNGNIDWFSFSALEGQTIHVELRFTNALGNLNLYLTRSNGATVRSSTSTTADVEIVDYVAPTSSLYAIKIAGLNSPSNAYSLTVLLQ